MANSFRKRRKRITYVSVTLFWVMVLGMHYSIIVLHLLPPNPITVLHPNQVERYVSPFFVQNWHLFAPTPPLINDSFQIQLSVIPIGSNEARLSEWVDVTTPLIWQGWRSRLSPAVTRFRTINGIVGNYRTFTYRRSKQRNFQPTEYDLLLARTYGRLLNVLAAEIYDKRRFQLVGIRGREVMEQIPPISEFESDEPAKELAGMTFDWIKPEYDELK